MFFCSISVAGNPLIGNAAYPNILSDYRASFARLKKMDADIFFAPHGNQFGLPEKLAKMKSGAPIAQCHNHCVDRAINAQLPIHAWCAAVMAVMAGRPFAINAEAIAVPLCLGVNVRGVRQQRLGNSLIGGRQNSMMRG
jgi:hypothetical protein